MYRKVLVAGATAAAIIGVGGAALATTGSTTNGSPSPAPSSSAKGNQHGKNGQDGKGGKHKLLKHLLHGEFVTKGKQSSTGSGGYVTHDLIKGTVTAVSATSITVQAADKTSETFVVGKDTKVKAKTKGAKPTTTTISKLAKGDQVVVAGTGTTTKTAKHVVEVPAK